jgi:ribose transport system permease protein
VRDVVKPRSGVLDAERSAADEASDVSLTRFRKSPQEHVASYAVVIVFVLLCVIFSFLAPSFATFGNVSAMVSSQAVLLILALAVTLPMRSGDFDLSISAVMAFASVVAGVLTTHHGVPVWAAILAALGTGFVVGVVNATLIVGIGLDAFISTLGTMTILGGLAVALTDGSVFVLQGAGGVITLSRYEFFGLPASAYYGWVLAILMWCLYRYVPFGRHLLFVGGNRDAALLMGLSVKRIRAIAFVGAAVISAFAGILLMGTLGAADPGIGPQYLLSPYAAVFLGSTTVELGRFNVAGTVVALYLITVGITGLQLLGAQSWVTDVFNGGALVLAILFARVVRVRMFRG